MPLPLMISGVHYYQIAGRYIFAGDLFVTRGTIYFFPMIDLEDQRNRIAKRVPNQLGLFVVVGTYLFQKLSTSYLSSNNLWEEGISDEQFRKKADAYIEAMKEERGDKLLSSTRGDSVLLPLPTRVKADEISHLKLTFASRLSFYAQSDSHDFNIGLLSKKRLRDALWEGGLGKV